ncbi:MAG: hypothetical protein A2W90_19190 [Bacteroidetes bacterium GWF2_42_66]|nr:MAG: hypothetical protein A2W92_06005 [Bacteroidetes bacterium GWA2_42_15]OFX98706.1 MAG: hypothetical protein A2W89_10500 [Bacteroidetes bacterium GWE2_42_39]OFY43095.1 MAG: hypothetical protein A2W90_19190 [Bacteroidetes bacterium GWF2_42_66]HBL77059.1 hypothetical protein [Prolixibacteraceae bacterium]HCU59887.1 hypothetical protein [Prolixibacteraceae bacterium]
MNQIKIHLPFFRTLYSQSASSLTIASIAAYLEKNGYRTEQYLFDRSNLRTVGRFISKFSLIQCEIVIAKVNYQDHHIIIPLLEELKKRKYANKVALCGPYAIQNFRSIMSTHKLIDAVLVGQPEIAALEFVQYCTSSNEHCFKEFSFAYRSSDNEDLIIDPLKIKKTIALDDLPFPKRSVELIEETTHVNLEASRGCHFNCSFCHHSKTNVNYRSPENVVKEIVYLNKVLGKTLFIFNDSCFWANPLDNERILKIANGIIREALDIRICIYLRIKPLIPIDVLEALVKAGLVRVFLGVESGINRIQHAFNKVTQNDDFITARNLFEKDFNLNVHIGFITIEHSSTIIEVEQNVDYLMQIEKLFRIGILVEPMRLIPNTALFVRLLNEGIIDRTLNYNEITYGYRFMHCETSAFLLGIQEIFRLRLGREAYRFEYYSTVVGLLNVLTKKILGELNFEIENHFQRVYTIRKQGMLLIYNYLKYKISKFKIESSYVFSINDFESIEFQKKFKQLSIEIEIAYGFLVAEVERNGASRAVKETYTGMEGIYA